MQSELSWNTRSGRISTWWIIRLRCLLGFSAWHQLRPMSFYEFVIANDEQMLLDYIEKTTTNTPIPQILADIHCVKLSHLNL
jgi:hypothetical protein